MSEDKNKKTTISLSEDTKNQLAQFEKTKGESFDTILQRVITNASNLCREKPEEDDVAVEGDSE